MAATHVSALITRSEDGKLISIQPIKSSVEAVMSLFHRQQTVRTESSSHLTETWTQDLLNVPRNNHSPRKSSLLNLQDRRLKEQFTQKEKGGKVSFQIHFGSSGLQETLSLLDELYGAAVVLFFQSPAASDVQENDVTPFYNCSISMQVKQERKNLYDYTYSHIYVGTKR